MIELPNAKIDIAIYRINVIESIIIKVIIKFLEATNVAFFFFVLTIVAMAIPKFTMLIMTEVIRMRVKIFSVSAEIPSSLNDSPMLIASQRVNAEI